LLKFFKNREKRKRDALEKIPTTIEKGGLHGQLVEGVEQRNPGQLERAVSLLRSKAFSFKFLTRTLHFK